MFLGSGLIFFCSRNERYFFFFLSFFRHARIACGRVCSHRCMFEKYVTTTSYLLLCNLFLSCGALFARVAFCFLPTVAIYNSVPIFCSFATRSSIKKCVAKNLEIFFPFKGFAKKRCAVELFWRCIAE